jgi:hypothetical protein
MWSQGHGILPGRSYDGIGTKTDCYRPCSGAAPVSSIIISSINNNTNSFYFDLDTLESQPSAVTQAVPLMLPDQSGNGMLTRYDSTGFEALDACVTVFRTPKGAA